MKMKTALTIAGSDSGGFCKELAGTGPAGGYLGAVTRRGGGAAECVGENAGAGDPDSAVLFQKEDVAPAGNEIPDVVDAGDFRRSQNGRGFVRFGGIRPVFSPAPQCTVVSERETFTCPGRDPDDFARSQCRQVSPDRTVAGNDGSVSQFAALVVTPCQQGAVFFKGQCVGKGGADLHDVIRNPDERGRKKRNEIGPGGLAFGGVVVSPCPEPAFFINGKWRVVSGVDIDDVGQEHKGFENEAVRFQTELPVLAAAGGPQCLVAGDEIDGGFTFCGTGHEDVVG